MEDSQIGMLKLEDYSCDISPCNGTQEVIRSTYAFAFVTQIAQFTDKDVNEDTQIVGIKVLLRVYRGEEEVENLEDKERDAKRVWTSICRPRIDQIISRPSEE